MAVADRWNLLKNLRETLERLLDRYQREFHGITLPVVARTSESSSVTRVRPLSDSVGSGRKFLGSPRSCQSDIDRIIVNLDHSGNSPDFANRIVGGL